MQVVFVQEQYFLQVQVVFLLYNPCPAKSECSFFNTVDPNQLAFNAPIWAGSTLFSSLKIYAYYDAADYRDKIWKDCRALYN